MGWYERYSQREGDVCVCVCVCVCGGGGGELYLLRLCGGSPHCLGQLLPHDGQAALLPPVLGRARHSSSALGSSCPTPAPETGQRRGEAVVGRHSAHAAAKEGGKSWMANSEASPLELLFKKANLSPTFPSFPPPNLIFY